MTLGSAVIALALPSNSSRVHRSTIETLTGIGMIGPAIDRCITTITSRFGIDPGGLVSGLEHNSSKRRWDRPSIGLPAPSPIGHRWHALERGRVHTIPAIQVEACPRGVAARLGSINRVRALLIAVTSLLTCPMNFKQCPSDRVYDFRQLCFSPRVAACSCALTADENATLR